MENENIFHSMPMSKLITKMSVPIIISMIVQALYNSVDSLFVAQLGLKSLTALGLVYPIQMIMISISTGIGVGMNSAVSQRFGKNDYKSAGKAVGSSIFIAFSTMVCMILFGLFLCRPFLEFCTDDPQIVELGVQYLSICMIVSFGQFFGIVGQRLLIVIGCPMAGMGCHLAGAVFNIVFDPLLIFGLLGFPALGISGAAIATVGGQILSAILSFGYFMLKNNTLKITFSDMKPDKIILEICKTGIPAAITLAISAIMSFGMNQILKAEAIALAVFTAYYKLWCFACMPINGLMQGIIPIVGYNYGAKLKERLNQAVKISLIFGISMMAVVTLVFEIIAPSLITLFDNGENGAEFIKMGTYALRIISATFVLYAIAQILSNIFQGMGEGMPSLIYAVLHQCLFLLPVAWLLLSLFGSNAVWFAFWIAEILSLVVVIFIFVRYKRKMIDALPSVCNGEQ